MYPLLITSLSACLLTSCSMGDWEAKNTPPPPVNTVSAISTPVAVSDPAIIRDTLILAYQEELLARDIYTYTVTKYPELSEVNNIITSEKQHQESVGQLLDTRGIARPTDYGSYSSTYTTLKSMIDASLTGALEVGIMVETGDIDHLLEEYKKVTDTDIRRVFENIGGASYNHLRAFMRLANTYGYTPKTDTSKYLSDTEANNGGPLMYKMTELLKANGLPTSGNTKGMGRGGMSGGSGQGRMNH